MWTDSWIRGHSLRELVEGLLTRDEMNLAVSDLRHEREWIKAISFQEYGNEEYTINYVEAFNCSKDGEFTTNSAYLLARAAHEPEPPFLARTLDLET